MGYNAGVISAPVSIYDLQVCFGRSDTDLGTLIANANINKWAKYKPVRSSTIDTVSGQWDATNNKWLSTASWWKSPGGMCGMATETATEFGNSLSTQGTFMYKLINGQLGWNYNRPAGGSSSPYRLQDLAGYNKNAIPPYGEIGSKKIYIQAGGSAQIDWEIIEVDDNNLKLSDFSFNGHPLTDFYLGLILWNSSQWHLFTSSSKFIAGESLSIVIDNASSLEGTWNCMPFFTLNRTNSGGTFDSNGLFVSMADTTPLSIELTTVGTTYFDTVEGIWNAANTAVSYTVGIENESAASHHFDAIIVSIYAESYTGTLLAQKTISNIDVSGNDSAQLTGSISVAKGSYTSYWIVVADATSGSTITRKYNQIEEYQETPD